MLKLKYNCACLVMLSILAITTGTRYHKAIQIINAYRSEGTEEGIVNITESEKLCKDAETIAKMNLTEWLLKSTGKVLKQIINKSMKIARPQDVVEKAIENFAVYAGLKARVRKLVNQNATYLSPLMTESLTVSSRKKPNIEYKFQAEPIVQSVQGDILLGQAAKGNYDLVIIKKIQPSSDDEENLLRMEAIALQEIGNHSGIVKMLHAGDVLDGTTYVVVFEMLLTDLYYMRQLCGELFSLETSVSLVMELIDTVAFIHSKDYVHRDIKEENIMIVLDANGKYHIKLIDFGVSARYRKDQNYFTESLESGGSPATMSPDSHYKDPPMPSDDIWSILYTFMIFVHGSVPWDGKCREIKNLQEKRSILKNTNRGGDKIKAIQAIDNDLYRLSAAVLKLKQNYLPNFIKEYPELKDLEGLLSIAKKEKEDVDYQEIKNMFANILKNHNIDSMGKLDWVERLRLLLRPGVLGEIGIGVHEGEHWSAIFLFPE